MAKKLLPASDSAPEEEMSVVVLKFKGSSETLRRSMDVVAQAIAALGNGAQVVTRAVGGRKAPSQIAASQETIDTEPIEEVDPETADSVDEPEPENTAAPGPKTPPKARKFKFIGAIGDNATTPLKDFVAQHGPTEINDKYLVVCLWLQSTAGFATYDADQVWTCFRTMEWTILSDFTQPMRLMKSKKSYFDNPERRKWKLNPHGLETAEAIKPATP